MPITNLDKGMSSNEEGNDNSETGFASSENGFSSSTTGNDSGIQSIKSKKNIMGMPSRDLTTPFQLPKRGTIHVQFGMVLVLFNLLLNVLFIFLLC